MNWTAFFTEWIQRLLDIMLSVKVWVLITTFVCVFTGVSISSAAATIITSVIGIREGYKVVRSKLGQGDRDKI